MISTNRILEELQRQLTNAKTTSDEAAMRESIAAMQSLCGLILGEKTPQPPFRDGELKENRPVQGVPPIGMSPAKEAYSAPMQSGLEGKVLDEEDANGGSLFDF
ncbi:YwdI family protein [Sporosarcina gallistercoris]|uniref:YwdI family protein n=1 Tax=Sporosarcina gallistercoris TaxID=2762245 RepID=A0ABR8PKF2_9BACL|nr:YwdI family protein [Sporosarcina gallistercoris]MBD7908658.1 YwdI family protein [Sporosarcina gallistercoris]